jgi:ATP-binding cassette subfamily F protein 3
LEAPETYSHPGRAQQLNRELSIIVDRLQATTTEWEAAGVRLTKLEAG